MHSVECKEYGIAALLCMRSHDPGPLPHPMLTHGRGSMRPLTMNTQPDFDVHDNTFKANGLCFRGGKGGEEYLQNKVPG